MQETWSGKAANQKIITDEKLLDELIRDKCTTIFRKGYIKINGHTMPERYLDLKPEIDKWEVNEEDIWICTYPKSGTTWTQEMAWMIVNNLDFKGGEVFLGTRSPFLELSSLFDCRYLKATVDQFEAPIFIEDSLSFAKSQKSPICFKCHLPWDLLPEQIQTGAKKPKIIYVIRNPKDACVSYYHHCRLLDGYRGDFQEFCALFLAGKVVYGSYWDHVLPFWARRNTPNILFLKYEDMKTDLPKIIGQVCDFLKRPLSKEKIQVLAKHLSFEEMKKNNAVNYQLTIDFIRKLKLSVTSEGAFMRSGTVGSHKAEMPDKIIQMFDEWNQKCTKGTDFPIYS